MRTDRPLILGCKVLQLPGSLDDYQAKRCTHTSSETKCHGRAYAEQQECTDTVVSSREEPFASSTHPALHAKETAILRTGLTSDATRSSTLAGNTVPGLRLTSTKCSWFPRSGIALAASLRKDENIRRNDDDHRYRKYTIGA